MREAPIAATLLATWFGCGFAPAAPGTVGSLGGLAVAYGLHFAFGWSRWHWIAMTAAMLAPAIWSATAYATAKADKDPGQVVIDEVLGVWLALAGATALNWKSWTLAFALFRIFDIWKPPPLRRLESLPGGTGIVADDLGAGLYAALVIFAAGCFNLY